MAIPHRNNNEAVCDEQTKELGFEKVPKQYGNHQSTRTVFLHPQSVIQLLTHKQTYKKGGMKQRMKQGNKRGKSN